MDIDVKLDHLVVFLSSTLLATGCTSNHIATPYLKLSCTSHEVTMGAFDSGYCEFNGYIMSSGAGVAILAPGFDSIDIRDCFLSQLCPLLNLTTDSISRVAVENSCAPTKIVGVAKFDWSEDGGALLSDVGLSELDKPIACDFGPGFNATPSK